MIKKCILFVLLISVGFCRLELIKISGELSDYSKTYMWPSYAQGGVRIDNENIYIPDQNRIYIQSRSRSDYSWQKLDLDGLNYFKIYRLNITHKIMYINVLYTDGKFYLFKVNRGRQGEIKAANNHPNNSQILRDKTGNILAGGIFRPNYSHMLENHDDESRPGKTAEEILQWKMFYENERGFSLSIYDTNLVLIDSANFTKRIGEDAKAFDDLHVKHPMDMAEDGNLFLIDHTNGYEIKVLSSSYASERNINVVNKQFKAIPQNLNTAKAKTLKSKSGTHSIAYALYVKGDLLVTSFYQSTTGRELPKPPYHYDVLTIAGEQRYSGELSYPIICEDDGDKIFLFVKKDGGWFGEDELFLVGMTIDELIAGFGEPSQIEKAIEQYAGEHK